jgi:hypothetical protein
MFGPMFFIANPNPSRAIRCVPHADVAREAVRGEIAHALIHEHAGHAQEHPIGHAPSGVASDHREVGAQDLAVPSGLSSVVTVMSPKFNTFTEAAIMPRNPLRWRRRRSSLSNPPDRSCESRALPCR